MADNSGRNSEADQTPRLEGDISEKTSEKGICDNVGEAASLSTDTASVPSDNTIDSPQTLITHSNDNVAEEATNLGCVSDSAAEEAVSVTQPTPDFDINASQHNSGQARKNTAGNEVTSHSSVNENALQSGPETSGSADAPSSASNSQDNGETGAQHLEEGNNEPDRDRQEAEGSKDEKVTPTGCYVRETGKTNTAPDAELKNSQSTQVTSHSAELSVCQTPINTTFREETDVLSAQFSSMSLDVEESCSETSSKTEGTPNKEQPHDSGDAKLKLGKGSDAKNTDAFGTSSQDLLGDEEQNRSNTCGRRVTETSHATVDETIDHHDAGESMEMVAMGCGLGKSKGKKEGEPDSEADLSYTEDSEQSMANKRARQILPSKPNINFASASGLQGQDNHGERNQRSTQVGGSKSCTGTSTDSANTAHSARHDEDLPCKKVKIRFLVHCRGEDGRTVTYMHSYPKEVGLNEWHLIKQNEVVEAYLKAAMEEFIGDNKTILLKITLQVKQSEAKKQLHQLSNSVHDVHKNMCTETVKCYQAAAAMKTIQKNYGRHVYCLCPTDTDIVVTALNHDIMNDVQKDLQQYFGEQRLGPENMTASSKSFKDVDVQQEGAKGNVAMRSLENLQEGNQNDGTGQTAQSATCQLKKGDEKRSSRPRTDLQRASSQRGQQSSSVGAHPGNGNSTIEKQPNTQALSPSSEKAQFQISNLQAVLLKSGPARERLLSMLMDSNMSVEPKSLSKRCVVVKTGNLEDVKQMLNYVVRTECIPLTVKDRGEISDILEKMKSSPMYPARLQVEREEEQQGVTCIRVAFDSSCEAEVESYLHQLRTKRVEVSLPKSMMRYFKSYYEDLKSTRGTVPSSVNISFEEGSEGHEVVVLKGARNDMDAALEALELMIAKVMLCKVPLDLRQSLFFDSPEGKKYLQEEVEGKHKCTITVDQPQERENFATLLEARFHEASWSQQKCHQVFLCQGNMATAKCECDVIILPLCGEWSPAQQEVLCRGFLPVNADQYTTMIGPSPKPRMLMIQCHGNNTRYKVVVMYVPFDMTGKRLHGVRETLKEILQNVVATETKICLPVMLNSKCSLIANLKAVLVGLTDSLTAVRCPTQVRLFVEDDFVESDTNLLCQKVEEHFHTRDWKTVRGKDSPKRPTFSAKLAVGGLLDFEADVVVNSSSCDLKLDQGMVSNILLNGAGSGLQDQCNMLYPKGLKDDMVAITDHFRLKQFHQIFHIFLPELKIKDLLMAHTEWLRSRVQSCLVLASIKGYKSIVFPTLGTGTLGYPADQVAKIMFAACRDFFTEIPHTTLSDVRIVCYHEKIHTFQAFKIEETRSVFQDDAQVVRDEVLEVKDTILHILMGDPLKHKSTADFILISENADKGFGNSKNVVRLSEGPKVKDEVKKVLEEMAQEPHKLYSLQINLQTFAPRNYKDIVSAVESKLSENQHLKVVIIVVSNEEEIHHVCGAFNKVSRKHNRNFIQKILKTEGKSLVQQATTEHQTQENTRGHLKVCGCLPAVHLALSELNQMEVPDKFHEEAKQLAIQIEEGSSVDKPNRQQEPIGNYSRGAFHELAVETAEEVKPEIKGSEPCSLWIPSSALSQRPEDLSHLTGVKPFTKLISFPSGLNFLFDFDSLHQLTPALHEKIKQLATTSDQAPTPTTAGLAANVPAHWSKELDALEHEALLNLLGQKFKDHFTSVDSNDSGKIVVKSKTRTPPQEMVSKIEALRREDLQLDPRGDNNFDTKEEGIEAYIKVLPGQEKVAVFGFEYNTMTKAKHLVSVKTGKIRTTTRSRRKFEDSGGLGNSPESSLQSQLPHYPSIDEQAGQKQLELKTPSGIKVFIYKTDITKLPVDAIVNAANEHLAHGGGVAYAIAKAAGFELEDEGQDYIKRHGPIKVTEVVATTAGSLPCEKVLHAVGPRWSDYKDKAQCCRDLTETVLNCLKEASKRKFASVAVTSVSSAIFGVPQQTCAQCYLSAVKRFDEQMGHHTSLAHIHFVDVNDSMVSIIQNTFWASWNKPISELLSLQHSTAGGEKDQASPRHHHRQAPASTGPDPFGVDHDSRGAEKMQIFPEFGVAKFNMHGLGIHFRTGNVLDWTADALVLWQDEKNIFGDELSRKFLATNSAFANDFVPSFKMLYAKHGGAVVMEKVKEMFVVLLFVSETSSTKQQDIHAGLVQALTRVHEAKARSIAIPRYPYTGRVLDHDLEAFATAAYYAVTNFSKLENKTITDIHFFDPERKTNNQLVDCFNLEFTKELSVATDKKSKLESSEESEAAAASKDACCICLGDFRNPKTLKKCGHTFCTECIDKSFKESNLQNRCPLCKKVYGPIFGDQPDGKMTFFFSNASLPGYGTGTYTIVYDFRPGRQKDLHPHPGTQYEKTTRTAYLPDTREGRKVLMLLKIAFDRRLIFTIGQSVSSGREDQITWNDIHHKTNTSGGSIRYGYPDPTYLKRVQDSLAEKGVTDEDLSARQKKFVENRSLLLQSALYSDFSHLI